MILISFQGRQRAEPSIGGRSRGSLQLKLPGEKHVFLWESNPISLLPHQMCIVATTWCAGAAMSMATDKVKKGRRPATDPDVTS